MPTRGLASLKNKILTLASHGQLQFGPVARMETKLTGARSRIRHAMI
jgi:hypothetical protein